MLALSLYDGILFVSRGVHTVSTRLEQAFYTIASLFHVLHHEDKRPTVIGFAN
jgi:hypothetical protein